MSDGTNPTARAFVGVGSNIDPERNVMGALEVLAGSPGVTLAGISTFYRTKALPVPDTPEGTTRRDPDYLNGVLELRTDLEPDDLVALLEEVEKARGRTRTSDKHAPRTMDLDLLLYLEPEPRIDTAPDSGFRTALPPHPEIRTRPFVAIPLREVAPALRLPPDGTPIREIAGAFDGPGGKPEIAFSERLRRRFLGT